MTQSFLYTVVGVFWAFFFYDARMKIRGRDMPRWVLWLFVVMWWPVIVACWVWGMERIRVRVLSLLRSAK